MKIILIGFQIIDPNCEQSMEGYTQPAFCPLFQLHSDATPRVGAGALGLVSPGVIQPAEPLPAPKALRKDSGWNLGHSTRVRHPSDRQLLSAYKAVC